MHDHKEHEEHEEADKTERAFRSLDWLREQVEQQIGEEKDGRRKARNKRKARLRAARQKRRG
jgi:hypothetical protein